MGRNCALSHAKPIGVVATISSGVQGVTWGLIYLVALLQKYCVFSVGNQQSQTFKHYLTAYISVERCPGTGGVLSCVPLTGPEMLLPWLIIGIISNLFLAASSLALALALLKLNKENYFVYINTWLFFELLTFIVDAGLTFIFAVDFMKLQTSVCLQDKGLGAIATALLLIISTHGVLLTLANLAFIIFFLAVSIKLYIRYNIKNKEIDLVSDWPSASSENSLFDFYDNQNKNDMVGIVNPIQEYPEYSAKGRWPTLKETAEKTRPPLRAWESRSDLVESTRTDQINNNINKREDMAGLQSGTARMRIYAKREQEGSTRGLSSGKQTEVVGEIQVIPEDYLRETKAINRKSDDQLPGTNTVNTLPPYKKSLSEVSLVRRDASYIRSPSSSLVTTPKTPVTSVPVAPPVPAAPPIPAAPIMTQPFKIPSSAVFETTTKFSSSPSEDIISEPDYTPPSNRKPFNTVSSPSNSSRPQLPMSLHEAIKNRPPLKPVFSRMKSTDC